MNQKERVDLAQWAMERTRKYGADEAAINVFHQRQVNIGYRDNELETLKETTQNSLSLDIYLDHKYSGHSTNDLRRETLDKFIEQAVASTKYLEKDEYRTLPDPKYYPTGKTPPDLKLTDPQFAGIEPEERIKRAAAAEKAALAVSDKIISASAGYSDAHYYVVKMHSNGFLGENEGTSFSAGAEVTVDDGQGGRPEDWYWCSTRFLNDLESPEILGANAAKRALQKIGADKIASGKYDMIVENQAAGRILWMLNQPLFGSTLYQKNSFLDGKIGHQIASEKLTMIDDPFIEKGLGSRWFDGDGLAAQKRTIIDQGVLKYYYIDNYYGKKLAMEPTSGGSSNLVIGTGQRSLHEMIKDVKKGILVTSFIGGNANPLTGDFSYGVMGMLVENGEIVKPINEMNISGNGNDFWHKLVETGNDLYVYSGWQRPSMHFKDVDFSGI